jgi:spore germination protein KC
LKKLICSILVLILICGFLSGCYDRREVDEAAYIIAIGVDKGKTNKLKITLQLAVPLAMAGGGGGGGDESEGGGDGGDAAKGSDIITLETPTIYAGFNMANNFISRQINLSHAKAIIFSKELAQEGIGDLINALPRGREFRPTINVIIARGEAEEFIKSVKPKMEANPSKYYELITSAYRYTAFTANTQFHNFYVAGKALYMQPVAVLGGVGAFKSSGDFSLEKSTYREKGKDIAFEGDFKAGSLPKTGGVKSELMGLAVFNAGKMIGELDGEETSYHLMVTGEYQHSYHAMIDPIQKDKFLVLDVKESRNPQQTVQIVDGKPVIGVKVKLEGDLVGIQSGINYESAEKTNILEKAVEDHIKEGIENYLNKTAKELHSDIAGFGRKAKGKVLTNQEWENFGWFKMYRDSTFNVNVDFKVRRPGLNIRTSPIRSSEE